jgi:hypothetical protein
MGCCRSRAGFGAQLWAPRAMRPKTLFLWALALIAACAGEVRDADAEADEEGTVSGPPTTPAMGSEAGNPDGKCNLPKDAQLEDVSAPKTVVGNGATSSCTADAFINAVAAGGVITFDCGEQPVTITLDRPAKVVNSTGPKIVIDGGNRVTLSGGKKTRILYMNTCDQAQGWTTSQCQNQDHPQLTVQNLTFIDGNSKNEKEFDGGGAIWVRGGRFKVINSRFFNNVCADTGDDVGGGAIRVFSQYQGLPCTWWAARSVTRPPATWVRTAVQSAASACPGPF